MNKRIFACINVLAVAVALATTCMGQAPAGNRSEPVLLPLNDAERKIDLRALLAGQPDFAATENYFSAREISGFSLSTKVARKGKQYRLDTGVATVISELHRPSLRLNGDQTYDEDVGNHEPYVSATSPLNPTDLLGFDDIQLSAVGAVDVDGSRLLKIQAKSTSFQQEVFLYADLSRKNLITIVEVIGSERRGIQRLVDVSFDVPASLFDLTGYKARPKFTWKKVETAKVTYRGSAVSDALVYRHGDYLFVHAGEFDHSFIDLRSKTAVTVVFRGMLLARDGNYIWRTKETEAISIGEPANVTKGESEYRVSVRTTPTSVTVPDSRKKDKTLLHIEW